VTVLLSASETVCAPLEYEPLAMPILTPALETETILKTGLELGKLAPMRTDSGLPFTEILTAPLRARLRAEVSTGLLRDAVVLDAIVLDGWVVELVAVAPESAVTCWLNGSLLAKVEKPVSCCFECLGGMSEFDSVVLVAGVAAAATTPGAVAAGSVVPGVVVAAVVVAAGAEDFFPPPR
jgi:hypothetical protein